MSAAPSIISVENGGGQIILTFRPEIAGDWNFTIVGDGYPIFKADCADKKDGSYTYTFIDKNSTFLVGNLMTITFSSGIAAFAYITSNVFTPSVPGDTTTVSAGDKSISMTITPSASNGGDAIDYYDITAVSDGYNTVTAQTTSGSYTLSPVVNGVAYTVSIRAHNNMGLGPAYTATVTPTSGFAIQGAAKDSATGIITIVVACPTNTDGFVAIQVDEFSEVITNISDMINNQDGTYTFTYDDSILNRYASGDIITLKQYSAAAVLIEARAATVLFASVPDMPQNVSVVPGSGTLVVSFDAPANDGGAAVADYKINVYDNAAKPTLLSTIEHVQSPYTITGLTNGATYNVSVQARNIIGLSMSTTYVSGTPAAASDGSSGGAGSGSGGLSDGGGHVPPPPTTDDPTTVPCFFGDAPVLTASGYVRMDEVREGDKVLTPEGVEVAIERVKCYRVTAGTATNPYVIPTGRFGATQRLLISPDHRVQTAEGMVEAKKLDLEQEEREGFLLYYNLELADGANMVVAGVAVESLAAVRRMVVPRAVFEKLIADKYGHLAAESVAQMIARTCRNLDGDRVEIPVMRRR